MIDLEPDLYLRGLPDFILKFQHATQHLNTLTSEIGPFIEGDLHPAGGGEFDIEDDWTVIKWGEVAPIPVRWPLVLGDFLHNARSCLDHLVYALVIANQGNAGKLTQFPIYATEKEWTPDIEERDPTAKPNPIEGVSSEAFQAIREMQPFRERTPKTRERDGLMHLLRMSNADKHRLLHTGAVHTGRIERLEFKPTGYVRILKRRTPNPGGRVERGAEIARVRLQWLREPDREIGVHFKQAAQVAFSEPGKPWIATVADLYKIINRVLEVGAHLERFLEPEELWFRGLRLHLGADPLGLPMRPIATATEAT